MGFVGRKRGQGRTHPHREIRGSWSTIRSFLVTLFSEIVESCVGNGKPANVLKVPKGVGEIRCLLQDDAVAFYLVWLN